MTKPKQDDPCPDHPDNINDSYPHEPTMAGVCAICGQELQMNEYDRMCADEPIEDDVIVELDDRSQITEVFGGGRLLVARDEIAANSIKCEKITKIVPGDGVTSGYRIRVTGCDESNEVRMELDAAEVDFLKRLITTVNANSSYSCEPRMKLFAAKRDALWQDGDPDDNYIEVEV